MNMKAISVRNPWAWLIFNMPDPKDIENRCWTTKHRGPLLIHAGALYDKMATPRYIKTRFGIEVPASLECGGIVGMVNLVDCVLGSDSKWYDGKSVNGKPNYGFVLRNPVKLPFYYCPGQLGIFEVGYPHDLGLY